MPERLCDTRKVTTLDDAKHTLGEIRRLTCQREIVLAKAEKKVAELTQTATAATEPLDRDIAALAKDLEVYILGHKADFEKVRQVKTPDGTFGLRKATKVEIVDAEAALDHILDAGYDECLKIVRTFVKEKIRVHFEAADPIRGCEVLSGDIASYTIAKALIEEARKNAGA